MEPKRLYKGIVPVDNMKKFNIVPDEKEDCDESFSENEPVKLRHPKRLVERRLCSLNYLHNFLCLAQQVSFLLFYN